MGYQQELLAILAKYPEIQDIKVIKEESIKRSNSAIAAPVATVEPKTPEAQAIAAVANAKPPLLDAFSVTETRYPVEVKTKPSVAAKKAQAQDASAAIKATMDALKVPKI